MYLCGDRVVNIRTGSTGYLLQIYQRNKRQYAVVLKDDRTRVHWSLDVITKMEIKKYSEHTLNFLGVVFRDYYENNVLKGR